MIDRDLYVQQKTAVLTDVLKGINTHLEDIAELFQIAELIKDELAIWENDIYGQWIKTSLSAVPPEQAKEIKLARERAAQLKHREQREREALEAKARERATEAKRLRKEAKAKH